MLYLLLAVGCSLAIGMIFKHAGRQGLDRVTLLTANYAVAALLALLLIALGAKHTAAGFTLAPGLVALGVGTGVLFIAGFFLLSLATDVAGMSVATGVMRVSVVIPFLASWLIWNEVPTLSQGLGLVCAGAAFFMIAARRDYNSGKKAGDGQRLPAAEKAVAVAGPPTSSVEAGAVDGRKQALHHSEGRGALRTVEAPSKDTGTQAVTALILLFLAGGAVDTSMKTFDEVFADESSRALFLLMVFGVAFLVGCLEMFRRRTSGWSAGRVLGWGALLGVVNYGSVEFILRAIRALRGPFVFPANNISIVMGAALLGVWFWGERLSTLNKAGLLMAALALFLLRP